MILTICILLFLSILGGIGFIILMIKEYKETKSSLSVLFGIYWACAIVFFAFTIFEQLIALK
jgi:uncharacterized protein with PQ loop repeat